MQFEARKIIDLQGDAAELRKLQGHVPGCHHPQGPVGVYFGALLLVLPRRKWGVQEAPMQVFTGLKGSKQVLEDLEESIVGREEEIEGLVGELS